MTDNNTTGLCDFLAAIGESGAVARRQCEQASIDSVQRYLTEPDKDGICDLQMCHIRIGERVIKAPLLGLVPPGHLDLKTLEIEFETIVDMKPPQIVSETTAGNPKINLGFSRGLMKRGTEVTVKAVYELNEALETTEQIRDKVNKLLALES